jgi:phage-related protein
VARTQAVYYRDERAVEPVFDFLDALPAKRRAKISEFIDEYLNDRAPAAPPAEFPITSQVDGELRELRVRFAGTRYRILYQRSENLAVLLHGIEKHTGPIPQSDIDLARRRMEDFTRRMNVSPRIPPRAAGRDAPSPRRRLP